MERSKRYKGVRLKANAVRAIYEAFGKAVSQEAPTTQLQIVTMSVGGDDDSWDFDTIDELLAGIDSPAVEWTLQVQTAPSPERRIWINAKDTEGFSIQVTSPTKSLIDVVYGVVHTKLEDSWQTPEQPGGALKAKSSGPRIFIGHGGSQDWRDLKDHLQDKHDYRVVAFEIGGPGWAHSSGRA